MEVQQEQQVQQEQMTFPQQRTVVLETEEMSRWEMDMKPFFDDIEHTLLGERKINGEWQRDHLLSRSMNELGASKYIQGIKSRANHHQQLSEFKSNEDIVISADAGKNFADQLEDNWELWEVEPSETNMEGIALQFYDNLFICLRMAKDGGIKKHRERRGVKTMFHPPQQEGVI